MSNPLIIKLGGTLLDNKEALKTLFHALQQYIKQQKRSVVIVHGGGCLVDKLMKSLDLPIKKKNGLRITPADQIEIITGALAGTANKKLLFWAKKYNIPALGLCLGDADIVIVKQFDKEMGYVGNAIPGNPKLLNILFNAGYIPIISSIGIAENSYLMNVNADQAATALAVTINANLVFLSDVNNIIDEQGYPITEITAEKAKQLIAIGIITNGMIVKINAALDAARILSRPVDIASWHQSEKLLALFKGRSIGTRIII
ncbi:acetylglutamate kinase [Pantoea sp. Aalb]|uniref:acetylglutamate kinase n=1 Tax=Pantoea sp. Aalb TaxID=2576762 RepID=UPI001325701C|nr:acetylglutamate kinase [Pantoea sp. Aalb]MXP67917.1 acetylglutamate kinase [Pantoea sp. Aalb]